MPGTTIRLYFVKPIGGPGAPKRIVLAVHSDPYTLSQILNAAGAGRAPGVSDIEELIHAGLTQLDDQTLRVPQLADAVPSVENGSGNWRPTAEWETT